MSGNSKVEPVSLKCVAATANDENITARKGSVRSTLGHRRTIKAPVLFLDYETTAKRNIAARRVVRAHAQPLKRA
jgi:hypothetical protein